MPITGPSSYIPTMNAFIAHWTAANVTLGVAGPVKLSNGELLQALIDNKFAIEFARNKVDDELNSREIARGQITLLKTSLLLRLNQFNEKVRAYLANTAYVTALPKTYTISEAEAKVLKPLNDMRSLWQKINDANLPQFNNADLILLGNYLLATFQGELAALKKAYEVYESTSLQTTLARGQRDDLQVKIYAILKGYRLVLPTYFAADSAMVESMPRLTPVSERLPAAVVLQGVWDTVTAKAKLTWTASVDPDLDHYELRAVPGPNYDNELETVVAEVSPAGPLTFSTSDDFETSGQINTYRLYVVLTTGTERGSNDVSITRP